MTPDEEWRPVVGYEGLYEVSDLGRVRSVDRFARAGAHGGMKFNEGLLLALMPSGDGRVQVSLSRASFSRPARVHVLVAAAFLGPRPKGLDICHWNGDATDNRVVNLRYDTKASNERDKVRHGTHHNANKVECPKGHPYTPENTRTYKNRRFCKTCAADWQRRRRARRASNSAGSSTAGKVTAAVTWVGAP